MGFTRNGVSARVVLRLGIRGWVGHGGIQPFRLYSIIYAHYLSQQGRAAREPDNADSILRKKTGGMCPPSPRLCILGTPRLGRTDGPDSSPSFPVPPDPGKGQEQCRRGRGWRLSRRGREPLGVGRGRPGAQAPPLTPAGREGEAVAGTQRARRRGERGGGGRPGTGWHPAGRSGLAANAVTCAVPPLAPASPARRALHS